MNDQAVGEKCVILTEGKLHGEWAYSAEKKHLYKRQIISPEDKEMFTSEKYKDCYFCIENIISLEVLTEERAKDVEDIIKGAGLGFLIGLATFGAGMGAAAGAALVGQQKTYLVEAVIINGEKIYMEITRKIYEALLIDTRSSERTVDLLVDPIVERFGGGDFNQDAYDFHQKELEKEKYLSRILGVVILTVVIMWIAGIE